MKETQKSEKNPKPETKSKGKFRRVMKSIWKYLYMFRGVIISIPVAVVAIMQALKNADHLPEEVGIELLSTGEFGMTVGRTTAVLVPLAVTGVCILMTCISKRTLFPWLISVFSIVLPLLIWFTNVYPA